MTGFEPWISGVGSNHSAIYPTFAKCLSVMRPMKEVLHKSIFVFQNSGQKTDAMVNFDHLELPETDRAPSETFRDMPRALDDLPSDVFDAIPRAVTAREEKRLEHYHKKLDRDRALRKAQREDRRESEQVIISSSYQCGTIESLFYLEL